MNRLLPCAVLLSTFAVQAQEPDVASLYELSTEGSSVKLKASEQGRVVIEIRTKPGAHVSDEAPLKLELKATGASLGQDKFALKDSVGKKAKGQEYANPRFEAPLTLTGAKANVEAKLSFFVCTEKLCARQQRTLALAVESAP